MDFSLFFIDFLSINTCINGFSINMAIDEGNTRTKSRRHPLGWIYNKKHDSV